jgi:hypothetical protein
MQVYVNLWSGKPIQSESERSGDVPPWLNRKRQPSTGSGLLGFQTVGLARGMSSVGLARGMSSVSGPGRRIRFGDVNDGSDAEGPRKWILQDSTGRRGGPSPRGGQSAMAMDFI